MQGGGSKYVEKEKVAKFVTQLEAEVIEDKMRISILSKFVAVVNQKTWLNIIVPLY